MSQINENNVQIKWTGLQIAADCTLYLPDPATFPVPVIARNGFISNEKLTIKTEASIKAKAKYTT